MIERKTYPKWAFSENEKEKAQINREIYKELCSKYRISDYPTAYNAAEKKAFAYQFPDDYDIILDRTPGFHHSTYAVVKNNTNLSRDEIALICDKGNLCFGYSMKGSQYYIFED